MSETWSREMLDVVLRSSGRAVPTDQPATVKVPESFEPRVAVDSPWQLSEEQIRQFYADGFTGPLRLCSREEMAESCAAVEKQVKRKSAVYGFPTGRDRHLDCPAIFQLATHPGLVERFAQLMGPDLLLWRTQFLPKPPGFHETAWHQETTFSLTGKSLRPVLIPQDLSSLFNLTAWVALEDVDIENGCPRFVRGSHLEPMRRMLLGQGERFAQFDLQFALDLEIPEDRVANVSLQAGEFLIFHGQTVHGAHANRSETRRRMGLNVRMCTPDVRIYDNIRVQRPFFFKEEFPLDQWGVWIARGQDRYGFNRQHAGPAHFDEVMAEPALV